MMVIISFPLRGGVPIYLSGMKEQYHVKAKLARQKKEWGHIPIQLDGRSLIYVDFHNAENSEGRGSRISPSYCPERQQPGSGFF